MAVANVFKITDERFSIERIEDYDLLIEVQQTRLKFLLRETNSKTIIWLEDHYLGASSSSSSLELKLKNIYSQHEFLKANFWNKIEITIHFPFYGVIPNAFFSRDLSEKYLKIQYPELDFEKYKIEEILVKDENFLFLIPKELISIFQNYYPTKQLRFSNTLANAIKYFETHERIQNKNLIIINDSWLEAIYIEQKTGIIKTEAVSLKSKLLVAVLSEIEKNGQLKTLIFGEITPFSSIYRLIKNRLKALEFGGIPRNCKLSQYFSEVPEQRYFTLLNKEF
jgi:hypothetical protein